MYNFQRSTEDDSTPLCIIQLADNTLGLHKTCLERLDMVCECAFNMVKRYILTRLMSRRGTQRESWRALEEHSNVFSTSSAISYITCPFMFRPPNSPPQLWSSHWDLAASVLFYLYCVTVTWHQRALQNPSRVTNSDWIPCAHLICKYTCTSLPHFFACSWQNVSFIECIPSIAILR